MDDFKLIDTKFQHLHEHIWDQFDVCKYMKNA